MLITKGGSKIFNEFLRAFYPPTPVLSDRQMPKYPNQPADVIQLLMCSDDMGNMVDPPVPQKRRDHILPHVKSLISSSAIDKNGLTIRQLDNGAISLSDIKECYTPTIAVCL